MEGGGEGGWGGRRAGREGGDKTLSRISSKNPLHKKLTFVVPFARIFSSRDQSEEPPNWKRRKP